MSPPRLSLGRFAANYLMAVGLALILWAAIAFAAREDTTPRPTVTVPPTQQWTTTTAPAAVPLTTAPVPTTTTTTAPPSTVPEPVPVPVTSTANESSDECQDAVSKVVGAIGIPSGWTITCTHQDRGADKGHTFVPGRAITIHNGPRYEFTVAHELGHAWDYTEIRADVIQARAEREAWLGHPMTDDVWYEWFANYGEAWADHFACSHGWCRP